MGRTVERRGVTACTYRTDYESSRSCYDFSLLLRSKSNPTRGFSSKPKIETTTSYRCDRLDFSNYQCLDPFNSTGSARPICSHPTNRGLNYILSFQIFLLSDYARVRRSNQSNMFGVPSSTWYFFILLLCVLLFRTLIERSLHYVQMFILRSTWDFFLMKFNLI